VKNPVGNSPLLACLPQPLQARLRSIARDHCTAFGTPRAFQTIFDENVEVFDHLCSHFGASHALLGLLLAEAGVRRADGSPIPLGTVSAALCRARERASARLDPGVIARRQASAAEADELLHAPAGSAERLQAPAGDDEALHPPAHDRISLQAPRETRRRPPPDVFRPVAPAPAGLSGEESQAATRRAASVLAKLRRER